MEHQYCIGDIVYFRAMRGGKYVVAKGRIITISLTDDDKVCYVVRMSDECLSRDGVYKYNTHEFYVSAKDIYPSQEEALNSIRYAKVDGFVKDIKDANLPQDVLKVLVDRLLSMYE